MKFNTQVIHAGQKPDPVYGSVMPPIYMTSTYAQEYPGKTKGYDYTRAGNPNFNALENLLSDLEQAKYATVFSSGLGGITAFLSTLRPNHRILVLYGLYGGSYRLFTEIFSKFNLDFKFIKPHQAKDTLSSFKPHWLFFETPTNPL